MKITILTLFPEMFVGPFSESIIKRAQEKELVEIEIINIRDFGIGRHKVVDDKPYGGGIGMVIKVDVIDRALKFVKETRPKTNQPLAEKVVLLDPRGKPFVQSAAKNLSCLRHLILLCGHYEGVDERVRSLVDETISIGDFVVTGGEIPAMLITDAVARLIPDVLKKEATAHESFSITRQDLDILLEYPQYTTPSEYSGMKVPEVLLSGNHKEIEKWRIEKAVKITKENRADLVNF